MLLSKAPCFTMGKARGLPLISDTCIYIEITIDLTVLMMQPFLNPSQITAVLLNQGEMKLKLQRCCPLCYSLNHQLKLNRHEIM